MRIAFVGGRYLHAGRHRRWAGLFPTARHAELAAAFAGQGHMPVLLADPDVQLPIDAARLVWRQDPDAVVVCGDSVPDVVIEALRASSVAVVVTTATIPPGPGAVHESDVHAVVAAAGAKAHAAEANEPLPNEPLPSDPHPAGSARSEVVPPALRAGTGIELARRDPDGTVRPNDPGVVAATLLAAQAAVLESGGPVNLCGLEAMAAADAAAFLAAVADELPGLAAGASLRVRAWGANDGLAAAAARLVPSVWLVVTDSHDVDDLRPAIASFEQTGVEVRVFARFGDDIDAVEDVVDIVLSTGVDLAYVWEDGTSRAVIADGDRILAETGSPSLAEQAFIGPVGPLAALLSGRLDPSTASGAIGALLVTGDPPSAPIEAAGLRTEVFRTGGPAVGTGRQWLLEAPAGSPPPLSGDGEVRLDGLTFEMSGYRRGRHVTPYESLVLRFDDFDDIEAFLADADHARRLGRFPSALLSGFTLLADTCAWGEPGACRCGQVGRAVCSDGHHIRTSVHGPVIGAISQSWIELARNARQEVAAAKRRRACRDCPVASLCSKDVCLSSLIGDGEYCQRRQARPWLVGYLDAIDAIRKVRSDPAQVVPRVGGFGGSIHEELAAASWPDRPPLVLMEWQGGFYGYCAARDQAFRLTPDTAFIAEALMVHPARAGAAAAIESRFRLTTEQTAVAMGRVERLLVQRGVVMADAAGSVGARR